MLCYQAKPLNFGSLRSLNKVSRYMMILKAVFKSQNSSLLVCLLDGWLLARSARTASLISNSSLPLKCAKEVFSKRTKL